MLLFAYASDKKSIIIIDYNQYFEEILFLLGQFYLPAFQLLLINICELYFFVP